jgi:hypothetical protein
VTTARNTTTIEATCGCVSRATGTTRIDVEGRGQVLQITRDTSAFTSGTAALRSVNVEVERIDAARWNPVKVITGIVEGDIAGAVGTAWYRVNADRV